MKILVLAAFIVAVSSGRLSGSKNVKEELGEISQWPWQVGQLYRYEVETQNLAHYEEGASAGNSFKARFTIRVKAPGYLQAKLENPQNAQVNQVLEHSEPMPEDLKYEPVPKLEMPFDVYYDGGRVLSLNLPSSVPLAQENLLKGLIGALQVDLTTHRNVQSSLDTYDKESHQGLFRKMETDVTGDCETLYTVSPVAPEWRRELPNFAMEEEPIEITKSKNYGHCHHRVDYHFGVPEGAEWTGTAHKPGKEQFIKRATVSRILVGKNGPIYKSETTSTVNVHPHVYGKQKAEVHSKVKILLISQDQDSEPEWPQPEGVREIKNLLYTLTHKQVTIDENSSSSSSSSESDEAHVNVESYNRVRRSARPKSVVAINKVIIKKRSEESSSSSSSESASAYVNEDIPKSNEPPYSALYMNPQPHGDKKQNPMNAQKLVQEIAQQLQNPNNMPKSDLLSKFNILVRVIASMSYGQLSQTSRSIEIAKSSNDNVKTDMWMIYRDAVAQAGTQPAFQQIKSWIQTKKMEGEEAAEVVASLVQSLRYPTKESMTQFFELAVSPEVSNQMLLNTTALIAATKYINMGQVNNETAHRRYPTHMYGRLSQKHDRFVELEILPRLSSELKQAIEQGDSHKSQVYIMAIGNLGHSAILDVFAPYLEGKITVSTYLRTKMVDSLRVLAEQRDRRVRAALYSILKNTAEHYEVRVAAALTIFMGRPTSAMMQAMAQMTNEDPSIEVRAALKSSIESAAKLKHPRFYENARTAQAVKDMLTKEEFGLYHSKKNIEQHSDEDDDFGIMTVLSRIRSKDSWFPKSYKYSWNTRYGWDQKTEFGAAVSSGQKLFNAFFDEVFQKSKKDNSQPSHKYSARKISEILNIQSQDDEPLEASFYLNVMNQQRYFTFNEEDIKNLGVKTGQYFSDLMKGVNKHYSKTVIRNQVSVMFPIASGMPFIYKYKEPTLVHVQSNTKGKVDLKDRDDYEAVVALDKELLYTFAQNYDGNVGFLDTLSNHHSSVGLVGKFQLHIPIRIHYEAQSGGIKLKVSPKEPEQDSTIFHYSIWPYSANQKKDTLVTFSLDPNTKVITRSNKVVSVDYKFGQQTGQLFQLQGYSYSKDYRNIANYLKSKDYLSNIITAFKQRDIAQTHFNLRYLGKQSKSKGATITVVYDTLYNQKTEGEMPSTASNVQNVTPNSPSRREELAKRVSAGIHAARVDVFDLGVQFESPEKLEYAYTSAIARSQVDPKVQYAYFIAKNTAQGSNQANAVGTFYKPTISLMNFREAVQKEFKMNFDIDISYNQKDNMHIQGTMERTKKYSEELQKHSLGQQCLREMESGNYQQRSCHEAIIMAHAPDSIKFTVTYKDLHPMFKHAIEQVYRTAQRLGMRHSERNEQKANPAGRIDLNIDASYLSHILNIDLKTVNGESIWSNVPIPKSSAVLLALYWPIKPYERLLNYYTGHQYLPYCSVDSNQVRTFSNRNYNYKLTNSWHVVLHDDRSQSNEALAVLARSRNENQQEFYISYRSHTGKELEIEVQPSPASEKSPVVKVNTNAKKISEGDLTTYWDEIDETPILEYYTNKDGVLVLNIRENRLRVLYDGSRLVSLAKQGRNNNRGICGHMSGEPRDDYLTPNGLIDVPELYGASYVLIEDDSDPKDQARQNQAKQRAYQPQHRNTVILQSDEQWRNEMQANDEKWGSQIIYNARNYLKEKKPCDVSPQVQSFENRGEICITTSPLPSCQSHCSGDGYTIQAAQVVCKSKFDLQFRSYRDQIRQGQNPRVSGASKLTQYRVPTSCNA